MNDRASLLNYLKKAAAVVALLIMTTPSHAGQFDAWQNSLKITFNYNENEPQTNFPVLVQLSTAIQGFNYSQFASASGADLRFSDGSGTLELSYEIESWNTSGTSYVWVKVPVLVGTLNTNFGDGNYCGLYGWDGSPFLSRYHNGILWAERQVDNYGGSFVPLGWVSGSMPLRHAALFAEGDPRPPVNWAPYGPSHVYAADELIGYWEYNGDAVYARSHNGVLWAQHQPSDGFWAGGNLTGVRVGVTPAQAIAHIGDIVSNLWDQLQFADRDPRSNPNPYDNAPLSTNQTLTSIRAYWGNGSATTPAYTTNGSAWSSSFGGVWHMANGQARDSRRQIADGALSGISSVAGKIGSGFSFNPTSNSYVNFGTVNIGLISNRMYTIEAWVKRTGVGSGTDVSVCYGNNGARKAAGLGVSGGGNLMSVHNQQDHTYSSTFANGQWEHLVLVHWGAAQYEGDTYIGGADSYCDQLYINGRLAGLRGNGGGTDPAHDWSTCLELAGSAPLLFGKPSWANNYCGAQTLDEVRISTSQRSYNWIRSSYLTVASNSQFTAYGAVSNSLPPPPNWTAYNDIAWESGQLTAKITQLGPASGQTASGSLIDYTSGASLGAVISFASSGNSPTIAGTVSTALPATGSDADTLFTNRVDVQSRLFWSGGSLTITVTGLSSTSRYSVALYGARGNAAYSTRWTDVTISDVSSFSNSSSSGSTILTGSMDDDTTRIVTGDNAAGRVFRFDDINPGGDGDLVLTLVGNGSETAYINALRVSTHPNGSDTNTPSTNAPPAGSSSWTAYNDFVANAAEPIANITTFAANSVGGTLKDYGTGQNLSVQVGMSIVGGSVGTTVDTPAPVTGSDASNVFASAVGLTGANSLNQGTLTLTFSGLNVTSRYSCVFYGSRGYTNYTYRSTAAIIGGVSSFINNSSAGSVIGTTTVSGDKTTILAANTEGRVARFDNIDAGPDGIFSLTIFGGSDPGSSTNAYVNAFLLKTYTAPNTTVPDSWKTNYFGTTNVNLNADADNDGMSNWAEWRAGTDPTAAGSRLAMSTQQPTNSPGGAVIQWSSVSGKTYGILQSTNLTMPMSLLQGGIVAVPPINTYTIPVSHVRGFMRVRIE